MAQDTTTTLEEALKSPAPKIDTRAAYDAVAPAIGLLVMFCANFDGWLHAAFDRITGKDGFSSLVLGKIDNLSLKLNIVFALAEISPHPVAKILIENAEAIRDAISLRNLLAHSPYQFNDKAELCLAVGMLSERKKFELKPISREMIDAQAMSMNAIIIAMRKAVGDPDRAVVWIPGKAPKNASPDRDAPTNPTKK